MLDETKLEETAQDDEGQEELCALIPKSLLETIRDEYLARTQFPYAWNADGAQMAAVAINQIIQRFFPEPEPTAVKPVAEVEQ